MRKIYKFHQFVKLDKGPVNTCITDLFKGDIYQVPNSLIHQFEQRQYSRIPEFIDSLEKAQLIIKVVENTWIPLIHNEDETLLEKTPLVLDLDEGVDIETVLNYFSSNEVEIIAIRVYCKNITGNVEYEIQGIPVMKVKKDFSQCKALSTISGDFQHINENEYYFNKRYNSCWGSKLAISKDYSVHPCIFSPLKLGNITEQDQSSWADILKEANLYRHITKSEVVWCKDCEFKFVCFDCREIARLEGGDLLAANPNCKYDPYEGSGF